jgi:hypothetical protein
LAVLVVGTSPLYVAFCRLVIFDMMLSFFVCAAIFAGYLAEGKEGRSKNLWYLLGATSSAFATLVKGPVGFVLPVLVLCAFNWVDGHRGAWKRLLAPRNVIVFFALTLPWFLSVTYRYHDFAYYGLIEESFRRYTTPAFRRTGPIYYYIPWVLGGCFAWSVLLPESIMNAWRSRTRWARADRLFVVWAVVAFLFFSISKSKRSDYILTIVVALGILTARVFVLAIDHRNQRATAAVLRGTAGLVLASALAAGLLGTAMLRPELVARLARVRSEEVAWWQPVYLPAMCALMVVAAVAATARWRCNARWAFASFVLLPCAVLAVSGGGLKRYAEARSTHALASRIPALPAQTEVACLECFPTGLPFYLNRRVTIISKDGNELTSNYIMFMLRKTSSWPLTVVPASEFNRWLGEQNRPVYLIARKKARETLDAVAAHRGVGVTELVSGWWGALLPAPAGA